jgi:hypothetical protein
MAIIVSSSSTGIDYALYGDKSHVVAGYVQQQLQQMPMYASAYQERMYQSLQNSYSYLTDSAVKHDIVRSLRTAGVDLGENFIVELRTFEELQKANLTMQRWVMADPFVRQLYLDQNVDGYSDTYLNTSDKYVGERDYHYQLAMSGVPVELDNGMTLTKFFHAEEDLRDGDRKLSHHEKIAVQRTWANARVVASELGFDFTCQSETPTKINFE